MKLPATPPLAPKVGPSRAPAGKGLPTDSLAVAMLAAARATLHVRSGQSLPNALKRELPPSATAQTRGAMHDIAYHTMRQRGRADALVSQFARRVVTPELLNELLVVAAALLLRKATASNADSAEGPDYTDFTIVDQAVEAANGTPELARGAGFVNAVLRSALRARPEWEAHGEIAETLNYPAWWTRRLQEAYPLTFQQILDAGDAAPPLTLRVNRRRLTCAQYLALLAENAMQGTQIGPSAIRLARPLPVELIPGFVEGLVSVQDEGAQRAALMLDVQDGQRVLDACAAPGGKSGHLLELADIDLVSLDSSAARLTRVSENLNRLGLQAQLVVGDAARPSEWSDGRLFDRILVDAPCTASGILRRHPDIRWLRRESDIASLSRQQQHILDALWRLLVPNGKLLFVTCSVFPEEGQGQADRFSAEHRDAAALPNCGQLLPTANGSDDHDGLFFASFQKIS